MRMEIERVFLRVEARRARKTALDAGMRCPTGCAAILADDTPALETWDAILLEQWRIRHGLSDLIHTEVPQSETTTLWGVGG